MSEHTTEVDMAAVPAPAAEGSRRFHLNAATIKDILIRYAMVWIMLLIMAFFSYRSARFATADNLLTILVAAAPFALIALGQTLVILTGGIDLSVGSVIAVSAMAAAYVAKNVTGNPGAALLVALAVGLLCGAISGLLVSVVHVPPFIATLGVMTAASGAAYVVGKGAPINGLPPSFGAIANTKVIGLTVPVLTMIVGIIVIAVLMKRTAYGMQVYAVGGNEQAARIAGVRTKGILFSVYAISGTLAGLSGLMLASRVISGPPNLGTGYELDAIAAVVIGGASLSGGRGSIWGTVIGLFLIQTLNNGLDILIVPAYWQKVVKGLLIVTAVAIDVWSTRRRSS
ncbi:ABC transporter permease [Raineyella sp. LH-20]|uniref:ABC transporter permease n=1 Tax=Raineyella sp. LH-20 TaxID=3081204 RepID=UPI00295591BC|nr:ABC transporter permease [Raineyella sp. LH-20]WOP19251.1 ABC transporter permease [Raineyella sp. LH-20]